MSAVSKSIDTVNLRTGAVTLGNIVMITGGQAVEHVAHDS